MQSVNQTINYLNSKYKLKKKIYGWRLLDYIEGILKNIFNDMNDFTWTNYSVYKQYFY